MSKMITIKSIVNGKLVNYVTEGGDRHFEIIVTQSTGEWESYRIDLDNMDAVQQERDELTARVLHLTTSLGRLLNDMDGYDHLINGGSIKDQARSAFNSTRLQSLSYIKAKAIREVAEKLKGRSDGERLIPVSEIIAEANRLEEESKCFVTNMEQ